MCVGDSKENIDKIKLKKKRRNKPADMVLFLYINSINRFIHAIL